MKLKCFLFTLAVLVMMAGCASGSRIIEQRGNINIRDLAFTGMSEICSSEKAARDEAMRDALAQVSLFDGASVNYMHFSHSEETNGTLKERSDTQVSILSKSLFRVLRFEYYIEHTQRPEGKAWQAWCHIPYSEELRQRFLEDLISSTESGIDTVENHLPEPFQASPEMYINNLASLWSYYSAAQITARAWFTAPNAYTAFLESKAALARQKIEEFYRALKLTASPGENNMISFAAHHKQRPYAGVVSVIEKNLVAIVDSVVVTKQSSGALIRVAPHKSGTTNLRVYIDRDRFPGVECYLDVSVTLRLNHLFTGKTIGLCCRDKSGAVSDTATALGKLITNTEAEVLELSSLSFDAATLQAASTGCAYLVIAEPSLIEVRENNEQKLHIAFPTLSLKIVDPITKQVIYQAGFPNTDLPDIRGLGKTREAAISAAFSFNKILSNPAFLRSFHELRK